MRLSRERKSVSMRYRICIGRGWAIISQMIKYNMIIDNALIDNAISGEKNNSGD